MVDVTQSFTPHDAIIHQFLHGYSDGHRLLEGSTEIPDEMGRIILRMSDLSGTSLVSGFEEYFTGYPLPGINAYALAKTWYAAEMPRPGCVWTHTLVLPASFIGLPESLSTVRSLFRRPKIRTDQGTYSVPAKITADPTKTREQNGEIGIPSSIMSRLIKLHYLTPAAAILIVAQNSLEYEDAIFALWSQKWPALRMNFTFCTGSLSARSFGKRPFEIQCIPRSALREASRDQGPDAVLFDTSIAEPGSEYLWVEVASADAAMRTQGNTRFRNFIWSVADENSGRTEFGAFASVFEVLESLETSVQVVAHRFPDHKAGGRLKVALFGSPEDRLPLATFRENELLKLFATTDCSDAFEPEMLKFLNRGQRLNISQPDVVPRLLVALFESSLNSLGQDIIAGLISGMTVETAIQVVRLRPRLLPSIFGARPELAVSPSLWLLGPDFKREMFEAVINCANLSAEVKSNIVGALLESGSDSFIRQAIERWGQVAIYRTLDWIEANQGDMPSTCRQALTFHATTVVTWLEDRPRSVESVIAAAHVVAPYSYEIVQHNTDVWRQALHTIQGKTDESTYVRTLLLGLALGNAPPSPLQLIAESFTFVHRLLADERLPDEAWIILQPLLPELSWHKNWDKCERLRRGLAAAFIRHSWPARNLRELMSDDNIFRQVLCSAKKVANGRTYFDMLIEQFLS